jgi:hypothetical protein
MEFDELRFDLNRYFNSQFCNYSGNSPESFSIIDNTRVSFSVDSQTSSVYFDDNDVYESGDRGWQTELSKWINFGETPVKLPSQLYAWIVRNANQGYDPNNPPGSIYFEIDYDNNILKMPSTSWADSYQIYTATKVTTDNIIMSASPVMEYSIDPNNVTAEQLLDSWGRQDIQISLADLAFSTEITGGVEHNENFGTGQNVERVTSDAVIFVIPKAGNKFILPSNGSYNLESYNRPLNAPIKVYVTRTKNYVVLDTKNKFCPENIEIVLVDSDGKADSSIPNDTLTIGTSLQRSKGSITLLTKGKLCDQPIKVNIID